MRAFFSRRQRRPEENTKALQFSGFPRTALTQLSRKKTLIRGSLERGFTLLEVMVALVIFAIVSVALVKNATMSVKQTSIIQDRTVAWWLAENAMTQLRIQPRNDDNYPNPGISRDTISVSDKEWEVETTIESTENEFVRRVEISVYTYGQEDTPAAVLTGFLGRY